MDNDETMKAGRHAGTDANPTAGSKAGRDAGEALKREARKEEEKVEDAKGSDLKKGAARVDERAKAANGRGPDASDEDGGDVVESADGPDGN